LLHHQTSLPPAFRFPDFWLASPDSYLRVSVTRPFDIPPIIDGQIGYDAIDALRLLAMGILLSLPSNYPGWRKPAGNLFLEPTFPAVYFYTVSLPFCGRRGKGLPRTGQNVQTFSKPGNISQVRRGSRGSRLGHLRHFLCVRYVY